MGLFAPQRESWIAATAQWITVDCSGSQWIAVDCSYSTVDHSGTVDRSGSQLQRSYRHHSGDRGSQLQASLTSNVSMRSSCALGLSFTIHRPRRTGYTHSTCRHSSLPAKPKYLHTSNCNEMFDSSSNDGVICTLS
eukprot:scaffold381_cov23-Tisochrysis_lutea.AAC.1